MVKVENRETLKLLARRFMKENRGRNRIAVLAILLTTLLFTSVFTAAASMILSDRESQIRQSRNSAHLTASNLTTQEQERAARAVRQEGEASQVGYGSYVGLVSDARFGFTAEVCYGDEAMARCANSLPTAGTLPRKEDEIAASTLILDTLGLPHRLGTQVTLSVEVNSLTGETRTDTFRLSGYWEGDRALNVQTAWVSREYAASAAPDSEEGTGSICLWYPGYGKLEQRAEQLNRAAGLTETDHAFTVNPAYVIFQEDGFSLGSLAALTGLILLSGCLIIYNVFSISIQMDMRVYGLLKNVGTTGKQLKKLVRMQAWRLCCMGIPMGLAAGYGLGCFMMPSVMAGIMEDKTRVVATSANPLILVFAALFSLITVYLSSFQACRRVERLTPVEALRFGESREGGRKTKGNIRASWWGMALANVRGGMGKGVIVMISIALSLIALNCVILLVRGYEPKEFLDAYQDADFQISQVSTTRTASNLQGVDREMREILDACPYSAGNAWVYYSDETRSIDGALKEKLEEIYRKYREFLSDVEEDAWKAVFDSGEIKVHLMGVNEDAFERLEWRGKPCTWKEFQKGDTVITGFPRRYYMDEGFVYYQKGDSLHMRYRSGQEGDYLVAGTANLPYSLGYPFTDLVHITVIVPEEEYIRRTGEDAAMCAGIYSIEGLLEQTWDYIEKAVLEKYEMLHVSSILEMRQNFRQYSDKFYLIGGILAAVLALIGIMNFFNMSATSILTRRRELALLETVGMTKGQIRNMLVAEGCLYLLGAFLIAVIAVPLAGEKLIAAIAGKAFFFHIKMTILPCVLMLPFLLVIAYGVPLYNFRSMSRESVVERIRCQ